MTAGSWPWPADTALDIARRLLQTYRTALEQRDPNVCKQIDDRATALGQGWVKPAVEVWGDDDLITTAEAAELASVTEAVIRNWALRGHVPRLSAPDGGRRYRAGDIRAHLAATRRARARQRNCGPRV